MHRFVLLCGLLVFFVAAPSALAAEQNPCRGIAPSTHGAPHKVGIAPPAAMTNVLGVLRRPARAADHLPSGFGAQQVLAGIERAVDINYVRAVGQTPTGVHVFVVPGLRPLPRRPTKRCLESLPKRIRRALLDELQRMRRAGPAVLAEVEIAEDGRSWGATQFTLADVRSGATIDVLPSVFASATTVSGIVPDGIAQVTVTTPAGPQASAAVADNFFVLQVPVRIRPGDRATLTWLNATGAVVKTIDYPHGPTRTGGASSSGSSSGFG